MTTRNPPADFNSRSPCFSPLTDRHLDRRRPLYFGSLILMVVMLARQHRRCQDWNRDLGIFNRIRFSGTSIPSASQKWCREFGTSAKPSPITASIIHRNSMYAVTLSRVPRWSQHEGLAPMGVSFPASPQHHISKNSTRLTSIRWMGTNSIHSRPCLERQPSQHKTNPGVAASTP